MKKLVRRALAVIAVVAVGAVVGPWVYINLVKDQAPDALTLEPATTSTIAPIQVSTSTTLADKSATDGQWTVIGESVVGYRVKEVIVGQNTEGVGRTSAINGSLTIVGESVTKAEFTVDMTTLKSDSTRRDRQVNTRILDTKTFPTATFALKEPIALTPEALAGREITVNTTGTLTLRGVTRDIAVSLIARLVDDVIEINGSIEIVFADWSIPDPSISAIVVEDRGQLEFLIRFAR